MMLGYKGRRPKMIDQIPFCRLGISELSPVHFLHYNCYPNYL